MTARENTLSIESSKFIQQLDLYLTDFDKTNIGRYAYKYEKDDEKIVFKIQDNSDVSINQLKVSISYNVSSKLFNDAVRSAMKFVSSKLDFTLELNFSLFKSEVNKAILFNDIIVARTYRKFCK